VTLLVPPFSGTTGIELSLPSLRDPALAAAKRLERSTESVVRLLLVFSGTVFVEGGDARLQAFPLPRASECRFLLPLETYRALSPDAARPRPHRREGARR
jgi:hypothetical protein